MKSANSVGPTVIVILGATGDLTWRKLIPGIYNLHLDKWLPQKFAVIGVSRTEMNDDAFREHVHNGVDKFSRSGKADPKDWAEFEKQISYNKGGFDEQSTYDTLEQQIEQIEKDW